jgi:hypothetical protein
MDSQPAAIYSIPDAVFGHEILSRLPVPHGTRYIDLENAIKQYAALRLVNKQFKRAIDNFEADFTTLYWHKTKKITIKVYLQDLLAFANRDYRYDPMNELIYEYCYAGLEKETKDKQPIIKKEMILLLNSFHNINKLHDNRTNLATVLWYGDVSIVKLFIEYGARLSNIKDGKSAVEIIDAIVKQRLEDPIYYSLELRLAQEIQEYIHNLQEAAGD